jgi:hypothetical protein
MYNRISNHKKLEEIYKLKKFEKSPTELVVFYGLQVCSVTVLSNKLLGYGIT